uniref:MBD domain-containing protein n=2 Tax=Araucaria cunninghamii TaxID=56994 RepID=A0A0D6QZI1_ARACU
MEFPRVHQTPGMQAGYSGVNQIVCPVPNANPRPADFFGRGGGMEAASHGLMACNAIDLGGGGDGKRGFRPTSVGPAAVSSGMNFRQGNSVGVSSGMNFGHGNPAGNPGVQRVDSEIMLSLDDILDDLHKKVVSGDANAFEVRGGAVKTHGFVSGNPKAQENVYEGGTVANLQRKNKQNKGNFAGSLQMERNKQSEAGVVCLSEGNEQEKGESVSLSNHQECEVAELQAKVEHHQKDGRFANLQETNEATGQLSTSDKGDASGLLPTNGQDKGAGSLEINQQEGAEVVQEAENPLQPETEKALELVGGGELQPVLSTPRKGKQISRRPTEIIDSPDWLPPGWRTELKTREAGSSAGLKDKYYYDPVSQRRFRSKVEVLTYLETGKVGRHRPKTEREVGRKRKSGLFYNAASLDPNIKLTKVRWVLDDSDGSWIPFVNEEELNGYNKKEGERCFDLNHNSADASKEVKQMS